MKFERLGENIKQVRGISYKPIDISAIPLPDYVPVLKANNIQEKGIDTKDLIYIHKGKVKPEQFIKKGDLLLAASSGSKEIVGKNIFFENDFEGSFGAFCKLVRPKPSIHPKFVGVFFKTPYFKRHIRNLINGALINNLKNEHIDSLLIPTLSKNDQLHIANLLSKADNLIRQRKESICMLDEFLKSTFLEMFGDPGINPKKWPVRKLEEYIEYMGDIGSNGSNEMVAKNLEMLDVEDYAIMIRTTNLTKNDFTNNIKYVTQKTYDFFKKSKIYGGEIIMNKIGSAGDFWLMPKLNRPVTLGLNQLVIRPKNLPTLYLFYYLSTDYGRMIVKSQAKGATTKSITKTAVKALPLMYPPVELQNKFVAIVEKTEAIKTQYQQSLQELENLYGSLSQRAFRGELTIKDESLLSSAELCRSMAAEPETKYGE